MKNTIATITLAATMMFTATFANAGILVSDRPAPPCETSKEGIMVSDRSGILVSDRAFVGGIIKDITIFITGIMVSDKPAAQCNSKEGILVSDRTGILVSD